MKRYVVGSIVLLLATLGWGERGMGEQVPTPRGELRIVDKDPQNYASIAWNIFDHLVEIDKDGKLVPRLATSWQWLDDRTLEMTLRQEVTFHNGEVFDADIVKLNWDETLRLQQPHRVWGLLELQTGIAPGDPRSVHGPLRVSGTGRRGHGQAGPHAYGQPPVLSRGRLGGEELVNCPRRWPVGHGPIQAGGRLLRPGQTCGPRRPGSQSGVLGHHPVTAAAPHHL